MDETWVSFAVGPKRQLEPLHERRLGPCQLRTPQEHRANADEANDARQPAPGVRGRSTDPGRLPHSTGLAHGHENDGRLGTRSRQSGSDRNIVTPRDTPTLATDHVSRSVDTQPRVEARRSNAQRHGERRQPPRRPRSSGAAVPGAHWAANCSASQRRCAIGDDTERSRPGTAQRRAPTPSNRNQSSSVRPRDRPASCHVYGADSRSLKSTSTRSTSTCAWPATIRCGANKLPQHHP